MGDVMFLACLCVPSSCFIDMCRFLCVGLEDKANCMW